MEVKVNEIFKVAVFGTELQKDTSRLAELIYDYKKSHPEGRQISNQGGWQSEDIDSLGEEFDSLIADLNVFCSGIADFIPFPPVVIDNVWVNVNGYMNFNWDHSHPNSILSGVYYIKVPSNSGNIKFINPATEAMGQPPVPRFSEYNGSVWELTPKENDAFVFPSWLRHRVCPNLNQNEERISLAFNCSLA